MIVERKTAKENDAAKMKFATAHDVLRRSFGSRWAKRVTLAILKRLMRHEDVKTTLKYYVDLDSDDIAAELWQSYDSTVGVGTSVGTSQNQAEPDTHKLAQT